MPRNPYLVIRQAYLSSGRIRKLALQLPEIRLSRSHTPAGSQMTVLNWCQDPPQVVCTYFALTVILIAFKLSQITMQSCITFVFAPLQNSRKRLHYSHIAAVFSKRAPEKTTIFYSRANSADKDSGMANLKCPLSGLKQKRLYLCFHFYRLGITNSRGVLCLTGKESLR